MVLLVESSYLASVTVKTAGETTEQKSLINQHATENARCDSSHLLARPKGFGGSWPD